MHTNRQQVDYIDIDEGPPLHTGRVYYNLCVWIFTKKMMQFKKRQCLSAANDTGGNNTLFYNDYKVHN